MNDKKPQRWKSFVRSTPVLGPTVAGVWRNVRSRILKQKLPNQDVVVGCLNTMKIKVRNPRESMIGRSLFITGVWEPEVTEFISLKLKPGMTVLDVGADIGYYSLLFASKIGPTGSVVAFEPIPQGKIFLDENIRINRLTNVSSYQFALSDRDGRAILSSPLKKSRLSLQAAKANEDDIEIDVRNFDEWKDSVNIHSVDLVKIDVEGAELMVLKGMQNTLISQMPSLLIEVHPDQLAYFGNDANDVVKFLTELGYEATPIDKSELVFDRGNITIYWNKR